MKSELKQVECDPKCGFLLRSHDEKELHKFVKTHAKSAHKMKVSDKDIEGMAKTVYA